MKGKGNSGGITVRDIAAGDWPALASGFRDFGFEQSLTYAAPAARRIGGEVRLVAVERAGAVLAAAAVRIRTIPGLQRGIAWIPSGPLLLPVNGDAPDDATMQAVLAALRAEFCGRQGHVLRLRLPGTAFHDAGRMDAIATAAGFGPCTRAPIYRSFAIDLHKDADTLLRDLNGKWRTDLRYALKSGLVLERGRGAAFEARFLKLFTDIQEAKGFRPDITPEFHFALSGPDMTHDILIATKDGADLAGIVIGTTGRTAVYLFGATADVGRGLRAGYFLTWEGIALARSRGGDWYDLGGVDFDANPDVARFKDRMNGHTVAAAGPYEAGPGGAFALLVAGLERARAHMRRRKGQA